MRLVYWLNCLFLAAAVYGQDAQRSGPPTVRANGEATINVKPDLAQLNIGVVTQGQTADSAAGQNAKQTSDLIAALKKELGERAEIQTSGYNIHPNYRQARDGSTPPTIAGYTASNTVQIKLSDITAVGKMIDAATRAGANNVHGIQFSLKDEQGSRAEALRAAVRVARANAEAMAAGVGLKLGRIVGLSDGDPVRVMPYRAEMMAAQRDAVSTPIEPGDVQLRAVVTVTFELQ